MANHADNMTLAGLHQKQKEKAHGELEPLAIGTKDLARLLGISVATLERWNDSGELGPAGIKKGGRRLWPVAEVRAWVDAGMPRRETWQAQKNRK
jgi:hypothetical protein